MKARTYNFIVFTYFGGIILLSFTAGFVFPNIPGYAYLSVALLMGLVFVFFVNPMLFKRTTTALNDERLERISEKAAFLAYRTVFGIGMLATMVLFQIKDAGGVFPIIARTSFCIIMSMLAIFQVSYAILKKKL